MNSFNVVLKPSVEKDLKTLPKTIISRVIERIEKLETDPFPSQSIKLAGADKMYRIRVGNYRIIYEVDSENKEVTVHYVRHRRDAYRGL